MADRTPVKATIVSGVATGLAEYATGDTVPVLNGGTGTTTSTGTTNIVLSNAPTLVGPKQNALQLGTSGTNSQNFVLSTNADGTMKLARGIVGTTTQDILTIDANGNVTVAGGSLRPNPSKKIACAVHLAATSQALTLNTLTKVIFDTATLNVNTGYNTANGRFTPDVPGWYWLATCVTITGTAASDNMQVYFYKNGLAHKRAAILTGASAVYQAVSIGGAAMVYLNGTTDYVEVFALRGQASGTANVPGGSVDATHFEANLAIPD